jgi:predicted DCC family thiol-disulfide oxidoreductase YuxK
MNEKDEVAESTLSWSGCHPPSVGDKIKEENGIKPVLIYDRHCLFCRKAAQWVEAKSKGSVFEMLPFQSETIGIRFPFIEKGGCMKAMQLILPGGRALSGEKAIPEIMGRLREYRWVAWLFKIPGARMFSHIIYRWFADHRYQMARIFFRDRNVSCAQRQCLSEVQGPRRKREGNGSTPYHMKLPNMEAPVCGPGALQKDRSTI